MEFAVYGSCVSRDVFNFLDNQKYKVDITIGSDPVTCMYDKGRISIEKEDIVIGSKFENRMIAHTLHKTARESLFTSNAEYICFDLAGERLPLQSWTLGEEKSVIPVTWNIFQLGRIFQNNEKYKDLKIANWHLSDDEREVWLGSVRMFCEDIKKRWDGKAIYLQIRQVDQFIEKDRSQIKSLTKDRNDIDEGIDDRGLRERQNGIIEEAERMMFELLPDLYVVPMLDYCMASANHHFGIHPLHFDYLYYEYAARAIKLIVDYPCKENEKKSIKQNLCFLKRSYEDKLLTLKSHCDGLGRRTEIFFWGGVGLYQIFSQMSDMKICDKVIGKSVNDVFAPSAKLNKKSEVFQGIEQDECREFMCDVNRNAADLLRYSETKVFLIDLMAESYDFLCFGKELYLSMDGYSEGLVQNLDTVYGNVHKKSYEGYGFEKVKAGLLELCRIINQKKMKVILNEMYYKELYFDGKRMKKFRGMTGRNAYLKKCYNILKQNVENIQCIAMPKYSFSYTDKGADGMSNEEYLYYQRTLKCLIDGSETGAIYREQCIKNERFVKDTNSLLRIRIIKNRISNMEENGEGYYG